MANMVTESKRELINQLEAQGWTLVNIIGKEWTVENSEGCTVKISVTAHKDGRQADYEITETHEDDEWEAEQAAQIKAELEYEIATLKERIERKAKLGYFDGKRGEAMRRHYERKLANAEELYAELFGNGYTCGATGKPCNRVQRADGSFPCDECTVGIEFRKAWEGQPALMDD